MALNVLFHSFWAPPTKTKPHSKFIMWMDSMYPLSAEWAFNNHMKINSHTPPSSHLFAFKDKDDVFIPMCKPFFLARCNQVWAFSNLSCLGGHSFHIGGTTHLLLIGVDLFIVMVQGRWKSTSFLGYWHNCEEIMPTFISFYLSSKSSVLASMVSFKHHLMNSL